MFRIFELLIFSTFLFGNGEATFIKLKTTLQNSNSNSKHPSSSHSQIDHVMTIHYQTHATRC